MAFLGLWHFSASALERAFVILAKLFPRAQEPLKRLRHGTRFGHEKVLVTLPARLQLDVAIVCAIAIVAFLPVVRANRVAVALVGIALVGVPAALHRSFVRGCARHLHLPSHPRKRQSDALVVRFVLKRSLTKQQTLINKCDTYCPLCFRHM